MSRFRKLQKTEGQRRSPRISALEAKAYDHCHLNNAQGPAFRTRGKNNTKLKSFQQLTPSPNQVVKHPHHHVIQKKLSGDDKPSKLSSLTLLPEKRILQLVLDTLQRRDTYEIFAEPVDPNEVDDYYAIIKEPMDFGTMRAKLHEGMYKNLEQFEHDVFLIFDNAMLFNSSSTIYFRQARVINELAKKVFDQLKNNPEKFELEFSETRRKVGRRNQGDFKDSTDLKSSEIGLSVPSKTMPCSSGSTSNKKSFKANYGLCSDILKHVDAKDVEITPGTEESSKCKSFEIDMRCTYRPLSLNKDKSIFSTVFGKLKLLEHVNQQDIGYKDSLMLFVRGLGPTAQNIAKRKLLGCEIHTASTSTPCKPGTCNTVTSYPNEIKTISGRKKVEGTLNAESEKRCNPLNGNTLCHRWSVGCDKEIPNQSFYIDPRAFAEDFTCLDKGSKEIGRKFQSYSMLESRLQNNCDFQSQPWASDVSCFVQDKSQMENNFMFRSKYVMGDNEAVSPTNEISCSSKAMKILKSEQTISMTSSFVFNLPYLKTRLDQIKSSEQYRSSQ